MKTTHDFEMRKVALLGGDQRQAEQMIEEGRGQGLVVEYFESILSMGFLGRFREYDAAIVHAALEPLSGLELAEYLEKLFKSLPMILLSDLTPLQGGQYLPASIIDHFSTDTAASRILGRIAETLSHTSRLLTQNR